MTEYSYPAAIAAMFAALAADSVVTEPPTVASTAEPDVPGLGILTASPIRRPF